jgi:hypothetical protein
MEMTMTQVGSPKIGDLVEEVLFGCDDGTRLCRIGVVIGEWPDEFDCGRMVKVCWAPSEKFPVSPEGYTCYVRETHLKVVS